MDLTFILVFVLVFFVSLLFTRKPKHLPPGHFGFPFFGSIFFVSKMKKKRTHLLFAEEAKKFGSVFSWYLGNQLIVVLSGCDVINEALVNKADAFSDRPSRKNSIFADDEKGIVFNHYDQCWRELRRFALHSLRNFGVGKATIEEKIKAEVMVVTDLLRASPGQPTAVSSLIQKLVANVVYGIIFGKRYEFHDPEFDRVINLSNVLNSASLTSASTFMPKFLARLISKKDTDIDQRKKEILEDMREYVRKQTEEHRATFDAENIRDFLDLYIETSIGRNDGKEAYINERNMFRVIVDLFVAGTETTTTTLDWAFLYLAEFPHIQKKCQEEIELVLGDRCVEYSDRNKLVYINAFIMEVHRYCCLVPLSIPHCTNQHTTVAGYDIPKGTVVYVSLYSVCMDPTLFNSPEKFDPDRFIDDTGKLKKEPPIVPFSAGPRACMGEGLARTFMFLVVTSLLQRFSFSPEYRDRPHGFVCDPSKSLNVPATYKLRVSRRQ